VLAALPPAVGAAWASALAATAADLAELRGVERARLFAVSSPGAGCVVAPLEPALAAAGAAAAEGCGREPRGTTVRHDARHAPLPGRASGEGGEAGGGWLTLAVALPSGRAAAAAAGAPPGTVLYRQATAAAAAAAAAAAGGAARAAARAAAPTARLCLACGSPALGQGPTSRAAPYTTAARASLFCGPPCDAAHALRTDGGAARAALFRAERGVCAGCGLDAHGLVQALRAIPRGVPGWRAARAAAFVRGAPAWAGAAASGAARAAAARLVSRATPGRAWQADHAVPVAEGGGACGLDNLRTLCTACHLAATRAQAGRRADANKRARAAGGIAGAATAVLPPPPPPRWIDESDEEESGNRAGPKPRERLALVELAAAGGGGGWQQRRRRKR